MPGNAKDRWTLTLNQFQANRFLVLSFSKSKLLGSTWSFIFMEKPNPNRKKKKNCCRKTYCSAKSLISEFFFGSWAPNWLQGNSRNLTLDQLNGVSLEMIHIKHQPGMSWHDQPDLMISILVDTSACGQLSEPSMCDVWLVGGIPTPLKNMKFSWDYDIPNIWKNKKCSKPPTRWLCFTMCDSVWLCLIACPACQKIHGLRMNIPSLFQPILGDVWSTALLTTH